MGQSRAEGTLQLETLWAVASEYLVACQSSSFGVLRFTLFQLQFLKKIKPPKTVGKMSGLVLTYSVILLQQSSDKGAHVKLLALQTKRFQGIKNKAPLRSLTWTPKGSCCC